MNLMNLMGNNSMMMSALGAMMRPKIYPQIYPRVCKNRVKSRGIADER